MNKKVKVVLKTEQYEKDRGLNGLGAVGRNHEIVPRKRPHTEV